MLVKAAAGAVLGFVLSACLLALGLAALPQHGQAWLVLALICFFPLWIAIVAATFMFRSGLRAWLVLGLLDVLCYGGLQMLHHLQPG
ncbi:hypothetical protein ACYJW8_04910 [Frateuria aurantia]